MGNWSSAQQEIQNCRLCEFRKIPYLRVPPQEKCRPKYEPLLPVQLYFVLVAPPWGGTYFWDETKRDAVRDGLFAALSSLRESKVRGFEPPILRLPIVVGGITDAMLATEIFDLEPRIGLFQDRHNLGFTESSPFHKNLLGHSARKLYELPVLDMGELTVGLSRSAYYHGSTDWQMRDASVIKALNQLVDAHPRWGVWKYYVRLRALGHPWNHKRIYRIYRQLGLNQPRRTKRRLPKRPSLPVFVPEGPNEVWSADFMSDALYHGARFRTFNIMDDFNREALAIEIDTSLRAERVIRVLERLKAARELPHMIRVDNGPEFLAQALQDWGKANRVLIYHIQPGRPTQNAFIERFNRTYRNEVLNLYLFDSLAEVREITARWMNIYNEQRPHEALKGVAPCRYDKPTPENSTYELSA